eukprot:6177955-Pleurochrysis_carterae.AAC.7
MRVRFFGVVEPASHRLRRGRRDKSYRRKSPRLLKHRMQHDVASSLKCVVLNEHSSSRHVPGRSPSARSLEDAQAETSKKRFRARRLI